MMALVTARKLSLGQGNIFSSVCQEFCPQGGEGGVCLSPCWDTTHPLGPGTPRACTPSSRPPGPDTLRTRHPLPQTRYPPRSACWEIRSTSGRYASYWNAILLTTILVPLPLYHLVAVNNYHHWLNTRKKRWPFNIVAAKVRFYCKVFIFLTVKATTVKCHSFINKQVYVINFLRLSLWRFCTVLKSLSS